MILYNKCLVVLYQLRKKGKVVKKRKRTFLDVLFTFLQNLYELLALQDPNLSNAKEYGSIRIRTCVRNPATIFWILVRTATGEGWGGLSPPPTHIALVTEQFRNQQVIRLRYTYTKTYYVIMRRSSKKRKPLDKISGLCQKSEQLFKWTRRRECPIPPPPPFLRKNERTAYETP